jgi:hypothetical protein
MRQVYRVSFFKKLVDSTGHPFEPCQGVVDIRAIHQERAIKNARLKFAEIKDVCDWSLRADYETVELLPARKRISVSVEGG